MAEVFISYRRDDRPRIEMIAGKLRALKIDVWFDARLEAGESFSAEIARELDQAQCVLVCWSAGAVASDWVRGEALKGKERGVLAACFIEKCALQPPFNTLHAEDLSLWSGSPEFDAWQKVLARIGKLTGRPGLAEWVRLEPRQTSAALYQWAKSYPADPLAEDAIEIAHGLETGEMQAQLQRQRVAREAELARAKEAAEQRALDLVERRKRLGDSRQRRQRVLTMIGAVAFVIVAAVAGLASWKAMNTPAVATVDPVEAAAWEKTKSAGASDIRGYLESYPAGADAQAARDRLALLDADAWTAAVQGNSVAAYQAYLTDFGADANPPGRQAALAQDKIAGLAQSETALRDGLAADLKKLKYMQGGRSVDDALADFERVHGYGTGGVTPLSLDRLTQAVAQSAALERDAKSHIAGEGPKLAGTCPSEDFRTYFEYQATAVRSQVLIDLLDTVMKRAKVCGGLAIQIVGHTDTSEPEPFFIALQRANAVRQALIARGASADWISTRSVGDLQLDLATGQGVREPLNRNVAVTFRF